MASFVLLKSEAKPLTRAIAEQFRDMEASPTERELSPARLRHLQEKAEAGHLVTFHWATAKLGAKMLRVNGQHSSAMLCNLAEPFPEGLQLHFDEYEVDSPEGLAVLFRQFDDRKSGRSAADVSGAYQMLFPELHEVARGVAKLGVEGVAWYRRNVEGTPVPSGDDQYSILQELGLHPFLRWLNEVFSIKTPEMKRAQVVSAMYTTFNANAREAHRFWEQVARGGLDYEENAPATVLDAWLKAASEDKKTREELKPAQFYQGCIYAWNAFREGKTIKDVRADTRKSLYKPIE